MSGSVSQDVAKAGTYKPHRSLTDEISRHVREPFPWLIVIFTVAVALAPVVMDDVSMRESLLLAAVYVILASNLNLMIGYAGYVNFGNIVFFGLGGYIGVYLATSWHVNLVLAALVGGIGVSALAYLFGRGILGLRGAFFALATIGVNEAIHAFVTNFEPWGGATGIYLSMDAYEPLGGPMNGLWICYFLIVVVMGLSLLLSYGVKTSKFGLGILAIGQNEDAAAVLGVPTPRYKAIIYAISGFFPAVAGGLYFFKSGIIEPNGAFDLTTSIEAIVMIMLGGAGTVTGPVIGAFLYEELRGFLLFSETFSHLQLVLAGVLLLIIVLFVPGGLLGWLRARLPWLRKWLQ
ncbi:MAG TPA: branched-chain amino acid ABC transporter permease [Pseudolabrys sp.]|nr:branched-chain amino acid ABC transporter permease [Pseudolabrys sp.]